MKTPAPHRGAGVFVPVPQRQRAPTARKRASWPFSGSGCVSCYGRSWAVGCSSKCLSPSSCLRRGPPPVDVRDRRRPREREAFRRHFQPPTPGRMRDEDSLARQVSGQDRSVQSDTTDMNTPAHMRLDMNSNDCNRALAPALRVEYADQRLYRGRDVQDCSYPSPRQWCSTCGGRREVEMCKTAHTASQRTAPRGGRLVASGVGRL